MTSYKRGMMCRREPAPCNWTAKYPLPGPMLFAAAERAAKKLGQGKKLSQRELRQFKLIPAFGLKIVHQF